MKIKKCLIVLFVLLPLSFAVLPALGADGAVNVNEADAGQLSLLPRIGPALAARIVEFREENGEFATTDDLMLVRGIGEKTLELLRPYVRISGDTTLASKVSVSQAQEAAAKADGASKKDSDG